MPEEQDKKAVIHTRKHLARLERERIQTRLILAAFIFTVVAVLGLILYGYLDVKFFQLRKPIAKVGDNSIYLKEFEARVRLQRLQLLNLYAQYSQYAQFGLDVSQQLQTFQQQLDDPAGLGANVLDQMIDEELIRREAEKRGISISAVELDTELEANFNFFPNGTSTPTVTPTPVFTPTIPESAFTIVTITPASQPEGIPTQDVFPTTTIIPTQTATPGPTSTPFPTSTPYTRSAYEQDFNDAMQRFDKQGFNEADYRKLIEANLLRDKLKDVISADVQPVQTQVWARHILLSDEAIALATIDRIKAGEDFGALAKEISQDTGSGAAGGDLGWFGKGQMVAPFEEAAFSLEPGVISPPVKSDFGWHIIQVIARQDRPLTSSEYQQARDQSFNEWLSTARVEYEVETFDFWKERVPTDPNFITQATEQAQQVQTANAEAGKEKEPSETPTPASQ
jgi:hypothetical protein